MATSIKPHPGTGVNKDSTQQITNKSLNLGKLFNRDPQFDTNTNQQKQFSPLKNSVVSETDNQPAADISFQNQRLDSHGNSNSDLQKIQQELEFLRRKVETLESQSLRNNNSLNPNQFPSTNIGVPLESKFHNTISNGYIDSRQQSPPASSQLSPQQLQQLQWSPLQPSAYSNLIFPTTFPQYNYITPFPTLTHSTPSVFSNNFGQATATTSLLSQKPLYPIFQPEQNNQTAQLLKTGEFGGDTQTKHEKIVADLDSKNSPNPKSASNISSRKLSDAVDLGIPL